MSSLPTIQATVRATGMLLCIAMLALFTSLTFSLYRSHSCDTALQSQKEVCTEEASAPDTLPNSTGFPDEKAPNDTGDVSADFVHVSSVQQEPSYRISFLYPFLPEAKLPELFGARFTPPPEC